MMSSYDEQQIENFIDGSSLTCENDSINHQEEEDDDEEYQDQNNEENILSEITLHQINSNIIKNILKAFFNYLTDTKNKEIIFEMVSKKPYNYIMKIIKKFIKQYKFNNYYLIRLLKNKGYSKVFEYYLTFDVSDWLYRSKIVDRKSHLECIDFLKECCINEKQLDQINTYKKKA